MSQTLFASYPRNILCPRCHRYIDVGQEVDVTLCSIEVLELDEVEKTWYEKKDIGLSFEWKDIVVIHSSCS